MSIRFARFASCLTVTLALALSAPARAASEVSALSIPAIVAVSASDPASLAVSGTLVVESVEQTGELLEVIVRRAGDSAASAVRLALESTGALSLAAGESIAAVSTASGVLLTRAGEVVAWLPRASGRSLLYHARRER